MQISAKDLKVGMKFKFITELDRYPLWCGQYDLGGTVTAMRICRRGEWVAEVYYENEDGEWEKSLNGTEIAEVETVAAGQFSEMRCTDCQNVVGYLQWTGGLVYCTSCAQSNGLKIRVGT